jgi:phospholipase C
MDKKTGLLLMASALTACSPATGGHIAALPLAGAAASHARSHGRAASGPIQHVVVLIQENRSFDELFQGYPGANTVTSGLTSSGQTVPLQPVTLKTGYDLTHGLADYLSDYDNGAMDGFNLEHVLGKTNLQFPEYAYVPQSETGLYFQLAQQYVLSDDTFASNLDDSFVAHQYLIAAQANSAVDLPTSAWGCNGGPNDQVGTITQDRQTGGAESPCFDSQTLGDELDAAGLGWRYYAPQLGKTGGIWSAYQAIDHIRNGNDWAADVVSPSSQILTDLKKGDLRSVTWVAPSWPLSDHPGNRSARGPDWVAKVVNAIGKSPFWSSTVVFVIWDDWGGWYDHVPPPQLDYDGLGFRVPMLVVSPYAKSNYVSHVQYESASIDRFIEDTFGLGQLAAADARATDPAGDCLNFSRQPRRFVPLPVSVSDGELERLSRSTVPPDDH